MKVHFPPLQILRLSRLTRDSNPASVSSTIMSLKRRLSSSFNLQTSKKLRLDLKPTCNLYERQWENVHKLDEEEGSEWFKFTVASYNVLSQNLLETNRHLYKKCQPKHLSMQYRKSVIRDELAFHQPDILCLQEVHCQEFSRFFLPELQKLGYFGLYKKRTSEKEDGCATFFKHDKFICVASKPIEYKQKGIEILNRDNVGLILLLQPVVPKKYKKQARESKQNKSGQMSSDCNSYKKRLNEFRLCVANTHLLFNPKRGDVKLAQLMTLMAGMDEIMEGMKHAVIMCGDFNSLPGSGLYDFLLSGRLDCKDVAVKFFSGQVERGKNDSLNDSREDVLGLSPQYQSLSPSFLEKVSFLTDQCQFVHVLRKRLEELKKTRNKRYRNSYGSIRRSTHWEPEASPQEDDESSSLTDYLSWSDSPISYTQCSGIITHKLQLKSAYDYGLYGDANSGSKQVTCYLERNCNTVDYILYSHSQNNGKTSGDSAENSRRNSLQSSDLYLLRRLKLFTETEMKCHYSCMPNADLGSDHTILLSEFGVKL